MMRYINSLFLYFTYITLLTCSFDLSSPIHEVYHDHKIQCGNGQERVTLVPQTCQHLKMKKRNPRIEAPKVPRGVGWGRVRGGVSPSPPGVVSGEGAQPLNGELTTVRKLSD